ncbi:unnamed protein product, partial [Iphiclides podalirius]
MATAIDRDATAPLLAPDVDSPRLRRDGSSPCRDGTCDDVTRGATGGRRVRESTTPPPSPVLALPPDASAAASPIGSVLRNAALPAHRGSRRGTPPPPPPRTGVNVR